MSLKTHYATYDRANESDNNDWWSDTLCGLDPYQYDNLSTTDRIPFVDCKHCLRRIAQYEQSAKEKKETQDQEY